MQRPPLSRRPRSGRSERRRASQLQSLIHLGFQRFPIALRSSPASLIGVSEPSAVKVVVRGACRPDWGREALCWQVSAAGMPLAEPAIADPTLSKLDASEHLEVAHVQSILVPEGGDGDLLAKQ